MRQDQLQSLFQVQIKIIHEELEEALGQRVARQRVYRVNRFLECLGECAIGQFESVSSLDKATVQALDLAMKIWPHAQYDQTEANRDLRRKILRIYQDDFKMVATRVSSRLSELGFDGFMCPFTDDSSGSNHYGITLRPIGPILADDDKAKSSQTNKYSGDLQNTELSGKEITHYEEIELPKSVWPRRMRSTKFKLEMTAAFLFFAALISTGYFYAFAMQKSPNLLLVGLSGFAMYFCIAAMFFTARAAHYREFSAPVFMWRPAANIPAVIVTPEKVGGREKSRLIEVKNVISRCSVCLAKGFPEAEAVVYLKPKFGSMKGRLEGVCSISDRHVYDYDSVTNKGCRQKVS